MMFTFKRDEKGHEHVFVDTTRVWQSHADMRMNTGWGRNLDGDVTPELLGKAIKEAEEAGFWDSEEHGYGCFHPAREVVVEVPTC